MLVKLVLHLSFAKLNYSYVPEYQCKYHGWGTQNVSTPSSSRKVICDASGKYVNVNIPGSVNGMAPHLMYWQNDSQEDSKPFKVTIERPPKDYQRDCEYEKKTYKIAPNTNFVILGNQEKKDCVKTDPVTEGTNVVNEAIQVANNPASSYQVTQPQPAPMNEAIQVANNPASSYQATQSQPAPVNGAIQVANSPALTYQTPQPQQAPVNTINCAEYCKNKAAAEAAGNNSCECTVVTTKEYHPTDLTPSAVPENTQPEDTSDPSQVTVIGQPDRQTQQVEPSQQVVSHTEAPLNIQPPQYISPTQIQPQYTPQDYYNYLAQQQAIQQQALVQQAQQCQEKKDCENSEREIKDLKNAVDTATTDLNNAIKSSPQNCQSKEQC